MTGTVAEPAAQVEQWLSRFEEALARGDAEGAAELFLEDSYWRDLVAFTWNLKTVEGPDGVQDMLEATLANAKPRGFATTEPPAEAEGVTEGWFEFETETGRGHGLLRLKDGKAWTLLTALRELKGHEEPRGPARPHGVEHGADRDRETWLEAREREAQELGHTRQPYVVIVGGGQGGIGLGARLRQLGVPTIIVERNERPGDSWRKRYKSLCLHDPVWYDHLPYIKFPENWPVFSPKDKIGDWLEMYTRVMELNYWGSTTAKRATYDEEKGEWVADRRARRRRRDPAAQAARAGAGHVEQAQRARDRGHGRLQGRPAPLLPAPRPRRLPRQAVRRDRLQQLGPRHLRGAVGARRRRDDGAALLDAHRALADADGDRARRALLRAGGRGRHHDGEGGHDLRLAAVPDPARVPDPALRRDARARQGLLRPARGGGLRARLGRGRLRPVHEVPAARLGLLHRRRRLGAGRRAARSSCSPARSPSSPSTPS